MSFRPLGTNLLIRRDPVADRAGNGLIIIPENARKKTGVGSVVAVGPGAVGRDGARIPMETAVGDRVLFNAELGHDVTVDGETLTLLSEDAVIGVEGP